MKGYSLLLVVLVSACAGDGAPPVARTPNDVNAVLVQGSLPVEDPAAAAWDRAPEHVAPLLLQDQTEPKLLAPGAASIRVRALHDGQMIAFRMEWEDATRDGFASGAEQSDGVAVQVPVRAGGDVPDAAMGQKGRPVRITLWKAALQDRLETSKDAVAALHPNAVSDHYPYEWADARSRPDLEDLYAPARFAKNPFTMGGGKSPVQELVAEGFGSLSAAPEGAARGRGAHQGAVWTVVLARPLDAGPDDALRAGKRTYAAFAVWDGARGNVGSRKMRTGWIPLNLAPMGNP